MFSTCLQWTLVILQFAENPIKIAGIFNFKDCMIFKTKENQTISSLYLLDRSMIPGGTQIIF